VVRQRSAKPRISGSNPDAASILKFLPDLLFPGIRDSMRAEARKESVFFGPSLEKVGDEFLPPGVAVIDKGNQPDREKGKKETND
jgi:hypothetical protein